MQSELDLLEEKAKEYILTKLKAKNTKLIAKKANFEAKNAEYIKLKNETAKLKVKNTKLLKQCIKMTILELETRNAILRPIIEEFAKKSEYSHLITQ
ncbi:6665_t:CDS:2 [Cetraspora pellucida]|uniref:6665_t:CDS:1 n=1 Tax=Cetraspora pellucida TaxID=1433469 RepID=A0A9N9EP22_9GLOM|nr:6665_t:CDS:2 [Cetraspora pellucida]